jgi:hypothetical protein
MTKVTGRETTCDIAAVTIHDWRRATHVAMDWLGHHGMQKNGADDNARAAWITVM